MSDHTVLANAVRMLAVDAVQLANSGHPGMPMGMADIAVVLWQDYLKHNPENPNWWDRDRVVVSNGHGSMLPYAMLHLTGYDLSIDDLKGFRKLNSRTAGHPEYGHTPGIETTTGPLGQGLANAVGMALAEKVLANRFNQDEHNLVDHHTYVLLGDGCLMEGISHEACSLAGTLGLGKLICLYDDNGISIDGDVQGWFTDDTAARFESYGWQVVRDVDGHDPQAIRQALDTARADADRPTLVCCKTTIGFGSPNKGGTAATHGAALGEEEVAATRAQLDWPHAPFEIPEEVYDALNASERGNTAEQSWQSLFETYADAYPERAKEFTRRMRGDLPADWQQLTETMIAEAAGESDNAVASRKSSQMALDAFGPHLPELIGGSADLAGSNNTIWKGSVDVNDGTEDGNYVYYGVREFGMTAISNGLALHGGFIPYSATFLVFSDYARNAVRMSALIPTRAIHVYTHDSIGLGEDGPTHQPIEHLNSLRLIPNMTLWRPADTVETMVAWQDAIERDNSPSCLIFSRQGLPPQQRSAQQIADIRRGAYVLLEEDAGKDIDAIVVATGSEVGLAMAAAREAIANGHNIRVVSMPSRCVFQRQPLEWREGVLPTHVRARVVIEAGSTMGWEGIAGDRGTIIGIDQFGASAPAKDLFETFGFTEQAVGKAISQSIEMNRSGESK